MNQRKLIPVISINIKAINSIVCGTLCVEIFINIARAPSCVTFTN